MKRKSKVVVKYKMIQVNERCGGIESEALRVQHWLRMLTAVEGKRERYETDKEGTNECSARRCGNAPR